VIPRDPLAAGGKDGNKKERKGEGREEKGWGSCTPTEVFFQKWASMVRAIS